MTLGEGCYILNDSCLYPRLWRGGCFSGQYSLHGPYFKFKELNHLGMNLDLAFVFFFSLFYFEINFRLQKICKNSAEFVTYVCYLFYPSVSNLHNCSRVLKPVKLTLAQCY